MSAALGYIVRRSGDGLIPQWISRAGYRTTVFGRVDKRHSSTPVLSRNPGDAYLFTSKASAEKQIARYYGWIAKQFIVERVYVRCEVCGSYFVDELTRAAHIDEQV